jgi:NAD(P)H-flavin reductase
MEIKPNFSGECVMIAAGTGILPFIDLLDLLLKKQLY